MTGTASKFDTLPMPKPRFAEQTADAFSENVSVRFMELVFVIELKNQGLRITQLNINIFSISEFPL